MTSEGSEGPAIGSIVTAWFSQVGVQVVGVLESIADETATVRVGDDLFTLPVADVTAIEED